MPRKRITFEEYEARNRSIGHRIGRLFHDECGPTILTMLLATVGIVLFICVLIVAVIVSACSGKEGCPATTQQQDDWINSPSNPANPLSPYSPLNPLSPFNPANPMNNPYK